MSRPDFVLIGAMKCGTSTLAAQLGAQEGVFMTTPKEPNYFSDDAVYQKGPRWYRALFEGAATEDLKGEASTHYTKLPDLPKTLPRMQEALDEVRVIYMIRDPLSRLVSHYIHEWSQGVLSAPLADALESHTPLVNYGRYGMQIEPWIEAWGRDAVLLTSLERMRADPDGELARVAAHIGFEGQTVWTEDLAAENVSAERVRKLPLQELLVDNPVATFLRRTLVPKSVRNRIRQSRQMQDRPEIPSKALPALKVTFERDRDTLARYFPGDPSLDLAYPWLVR